MAKYLKLFKCEICSKIFERKYGLRKHIEIVHDENFSNIFERKYKLRNQIKIVLEENFPNVIFVTEYLKRFKYEIFFKCKICDKMFETFEM